MFTIRHINANQSEFLISAGSLTVRKYPNEKGEPLIQLCARETDGENSGVIGVWGGIDDPYPTHLDPNQGVSTMYVMNDAGATVAKYRYVIDMDTLIETGPPVSDEDLPADMQIAA